jgi:stage II sporulation protein D
VAGTTVNPRYTYVATRSGAGVKVRRSGGGTVGTFSGVFVVRPGSSPARLLGTAINGVNGGAYRGNFELRPGTSGGVTAVNAASIDDYVQGVVPGEMPSLWPDEALKAQAVAARSYALATDAGGDVFDQYPDTRSQVYYGVSHEQVSTNNAVRATSGEVVKYGGVTIPAFFFSTSGGETENIENVWYGSAPRPYLKGVEDPYDGIAPRHRWTFTFTTRQVQSRLRGYVKGKFRGLKVLRRGFSPRVISADVLGSRGRSRINGTTLRQRLGLYDNWLTMRKVTTTAARASSVGGIVGASAVRSIRASIEPPPRSYRALVERKVGRRWTLVGEVRLSRAGAAYVKLDRAGVYRVRSGSIEGPAVRVR